MVQIAVLDAAWDRENVPGKSAVIGNAQEKFIKVLPRRGGWRDKTGIGPKAGKPRRIRGRACRIAAGDDNVAVLVGARPIIQGREHLRNLRVSYADVVCSHDDNDEGSDVMEVK